MVTAVFLHFYLICCVSGPQCCLRLADPEFTNPAPEKAQFSNVNISPTVSGWKSPAVPTSKLQKKPNNRPTDRPSRVRNATASVNLSGKSLHFNFNLDLSVTGYQLPAGFPFQSKGLNVGKQQRRQQQNPSSPDADNNQYNWTDGRFSFSGEAKWNLTADATHLLHTRTHTRRPLFLLTSDSD